MLSTVNRCKTVRKSRVGESRSSNRDDVSAVLQSPKGASINVKIPISHNGGFSLVLRQEEPVPIFHLSNALYLNETLLAFAAE